MERLQENTDDAVASGRALPEPNPGSAGTGRRRLLQGAFIDTKSVFDKLAQVATETTDDLIQLRSALILLKSPMEVRLTG